MTDEKYRQIKRRIELELDAYGGANGVSVSLINNSRYMFLAEMFNEIVSVINPIIELGDNNYMKFKNEFYDLSTLNKVDNDTDALLRMIY